MSLLYDEGQLAIAAESRRVLEARVQFGHLLPLLEQQGQFHAAFWETVKEQGWTALALPEAYGGLDLTLIELGLIAFQAGRSLSGAPFLTSSYGAARAILSATFRPTAMSFPACSFPSPRGIFVTRSFWISGIFPRR